MPTSCGASGAYGVLLTDFPAMAAIYAELKTFVAARLAELDEAMDTVAPNEFKADELRPFCERLIKAFAEDGVIVSESATLHWTGSEDDRPAQCETAADEWVLGWGMFLDPWKYPEMDASFRSKAAYHTWVWMG